MGKTRKTKSTKSVGNHSRRSALTTVGSRTDIGCVRDHNEDSLVVTPPLFVVADGMGGHAAGEVASEIAVNVIAKEAPTTIDANGLAQAVEAANREVLLASHDGRGREGMGTTVTAAILEGERLLVAQVGDSRAYLFHNGKLQQITRDHSLMADLIEAGKITPEEARVHPQRSVITRALGSDPLMRPDIYEIDVATGDKLLLCSDGLSSMITNEQIEAVMRRTADPQRCAAQLVNEAIAAGGYDNVTVIVADVTGQAEKKMKKAVGKSRRWLALIISLFVLIVAGAVAGFGYYATHSAYVADDHGKVAVYSGIPGDFLGISFSLFEYDTDISVEDLQPGVAKRLQEGIRVDDLEAAEALVAEYQKEIDAKRGGSSSSSASNASPDKTSSSREGEDENASNSNTVTNAQSATASGSKASSGDSEADSNTASTTKSSSTSSSASASASTSDISNARSNAGSASSGETEEGGMSTASTREA